jgi:hypothetical protein
MHEIIIPSQKVPVIDEANICVIGGSCSGVFAAIRAARLGAKVIIIEKQNRFGGVATSSLVNMWHSIYDFDRKEQIIAGLTVEVMERLKKRDAIVDFHNRDSYGVPFNSEELTIELDELIKETGVKPYLHTFFTTPIVEDDILTAVTVENKSGKGAIKAKVFIDASGDADVCERMHLPTYIPKHIQPPTTCAKFADWHFPENVEIHKIIREHAQEFNLPDGFNWGTPVPGSEGYMMAGTRVAGKNCSDADELTYCEIEGRRQLRCIMDIFRKYLPQYIPSLQALPSYIGIRETRHIHSEYQLKGEDLLYGKRFDDAIANGTYPVDIHHQDKPGITFKNLDGKSSYCRVGYPSVNGRWREETPDFPKFYQIPLRSIIPKDSVNIITAGRMIDADEEAFGAVRVMVNLNQTGEAAGVAAWLSLDLNQPISKLDPAKVRKTLKVI